MEIKSTEDKAERVQLSEAEWERRYQLEKEIQEIFVTEEMYWQKQGGEKWILKGDTNNRFFHGVANGRKKKCTIFSLEDNSQTITGKEGLRKHIEEYYKQLFGKKNNNDLSLNMDIWRDQGSLTTEEAQSLIKPFTMGKLRGRSEV